MNVKTVEVATFCCTCGPSLNSFGDDLLASWSKHCMSYCLCYNLPPLQLVPLSPTHSIFIISHWSDIHNNNQNYKLKYLSLPAKMISLQVVLRTRQTVGPLTEGLNFKWMLALEHLIRHHLHRRGQIWKGPSSEKRLEVLIHISKTKTDEPMFEYRII